VSACPGTSGDGYPFALGMLGELWARCHAVHAIDFATLLGREIELACRQTQCDLGAAYAF
jgi:hypothetical protein